MADKKKKYCYLVVTTREGKIFVMVGPQDWKQTDFLWNHGDGYMESVFPVNTRKVPLLNTHKLPKKAFGLY